MITSIEALKAACSLKEVVVQIKGTDQEIKLRELSVKDRSDHIAMMKEHENDYHYQAAWVVARSCPDLKDGDVDALMELGANHVQLLAAEVFRVSGLLSEKTEEVLKN